MNICDKCGKSAHVSIHDDSFDFSGTHCTNGYSDTHQGHKQVLTECCQDTFHEIHNDDPEYQHQLFIKE